MHQFMLQCVSKEDSVPQKSCACLGSYQKLTLIEHSKVTLLTIRTKKNSYEMTHTVIDPSHTRNVRITEG